MMGFTVASPILMAKLNTADRKLLILRYAQDDHEEHKDAQNFRIEDGLSINARPDWTGVKEECGIYGEMDKLGPEQRDELRLKSLQAGKISSSRLFFGVRRGSEKGVGYDDSGVFNKNKWGCNAIKLYVDSTTSPTSRSTTPLASRLRKCGT